MTDGIRDSGFGIRAPSPERIPDPNPPIPALYAILDTEVAERAGWTVTDLASACLNGGARLLQLRAKHASSGWILDAVLPIVETAHRAGARVIVNDRADLARLSGADGVHLGQEDLAPAAARTIIGAGGMIGVSTHSSTQLIAALDESVEYVALGPVFATATKTTGYDAVGLDAVRRAAALAHARAVPLVAIGGITLDTARDVIDAGATSVAVISDLVATCDPERRVRAYVERLTL